MLIKGFILLLKHNDLPDHHPELFFFPESTKININITEYVFYLCLLKIRPNIPNTKPYPPGSESD